MRILYSLIILVFLAPIVWGCENFQVSVNIVGNRKVASPLQTREVDLRITNKTGCSIFVKGVQVSSFFPITTYLRRYPKKRKWESPLGGSRIPKYEDLSSSKYDDLELRSGDSLDFTSLTGDSDRSVKLKIVVYVSVGNSKSTPKSIVSPVFFFNGQLD
jgi:hypothetical protein